MRVKYEESLHMEALYLLRYIGYTNYIGIPSKKIKVGVDKYYPLRWDETKEYTLEEIKALSNVKEPYITNGKLRGYLDTRGNLWDKKKEIVIAKMENNKLTYYN